MFIEVEYRGEKIKVQVYSLKTSFDVSASGFVTYFVDGLDENGFYRILFSSSDASEAWGMYQRYKAMCDEVKRQEVQDA